jgi:predicted DNA-binding transcriptional regulator YafY
MSVRKRIVFRRQWQLIFALHRTRRGLSVAQLFDELATSRATVYRDIALLQEAGCPIESETVNGEARYKLSDARMPALEINAKQLAAIFVARSALAGLEGTSLVRELDTLFKSNRMRGPGRIGVSLARPRVPWVAHVNVIESAIDRGWRLRLRYRGVRDAAPRWRRVDALHIRVVDGHAYLVAFDLDAEAFRTFKLARMSIVQTLKERSGRYPTFDENALFRDAAKVWSGPSVEVVVRLSPTAKRFAQEYPLRSDQRVTDEPDGSLLVRATVAGTVEAMRWVLSWGKDAEAVAPPELREAVRAHLADGLSHYEAVPSKPRRLGFRKALKQAVSRDRETGAG